MSNSLFAVRDLNFQTPPQRASPQVIKKQNKMRQYKFIPSFEIEQISQKLRFSNVKKDKIEYELPQQQEDDFELLNLTSAKKPKNTRLLQPKNLNEQIKKDQQFEDSYEEYQETQSHKKRKFEGICINLSDQFESMSLEQNNNNIGSLQLSPNSLRVQFENEVTQRDNEVVNLERQFSNLFSNQQSQQQQQRIQYPQQQYQQPFQVYQEQENVRNLENRKSTSNNVKKQSKQKNQEVKRKSILKFR